MKIAEVRERNGSSSDAPRYYEQIGLIPKINENECDVRDYTGIDTRRIEFINCMRSRAPNLNIN